jgi:hypothetical protein
MSCSTPALDMMPSSADEPFAVRMPGEDIAALSICAR